jgi:tRNA G18 (ribose-2'-O)-methylase SpoU
VDDPRLDDYRALNDPERRRRVERRGQFFVVEGMLAVEALLASPYRVRSVLAAESAADRVRGLLARAPGGVAGDGGDGDDGDVLVVQPDADVAAIAGFAFHRGVLAAADRRPLPPVAEVVAGVARVAVLEGLNDHENVGGLFRNAAAFAVGAVLLDPTTADPLYRRSVRVSLGHVLRVPWARFPEWPAGLDELRAAGFTLVALTPSPDAEPIDALAADLGESPTDRDGPPTDRDGPPGGGPERLALLFGAEGPGLSPAALAAADRRVRIPIAAGVDSLNVATAAAVAFHRLYDRHVSSE